MSRFASAPWALKAAYVASLAVIAGAALAMLAILIALAGLHRLTPHLHLAAVPAWLWYFRGDGRVQHWLAVGAIGAVTIAGVVAIGVAQTLRPPLHGAARWASESELAAQGLRARKGIVLGSKAGRLLVSDGPEHVLLHAPTRSGKGVGVVIPNLLTWPDSAVVLDIKRENWDASAGFRAAHGQDVILFDPFDPQGRTARFNPLGHIDRADPAEVLEELQKIAVMLFPTPRNTDPFWAESARTGFLGVGAYVAQTPSLAFSLGAIWGELTVPDLRARLKAMLEARSRAGDPLSSGAASALGDFCSASDNTFASIKQTITARLNLWLSPRVRAATEASDFDLRDLRRRRMSLYLAVSPDNLVRAAPLYSLIFQQLIDFSTRQRPAPERDQIRVLVLLDEFARLGQAPVLAHAFSYVAAYGLRLLLVLQSPAQLRAEYGPDLAEEIISNCGVEIAFAPKELQVAQNLSERIGYWTYQGRSTSGPTLFSSGRRSTTQSDQRRALIMPQELIQMSANELIVLRAGMAPARARKIVYWKERAFARRVLAPPPVAALPSPAWFPPPSLAAEALGDRRSAPNAESEDALDLQWMVSAAEQTLEPLPDHPSPEQAKEWTDSYLRAPRGRPRPSDGRES